MQKNPYEFTFEEYLSFHNNVVRNAEQNSTEVRDSENESMSDDKFMKFHNLVSLDEFLNDMNQKYGI